MSKLKDQLKSIFFKVEKVDAKEYLSSDLSFNNSMSNFIIAHTKEGPRVVNTCSPNYHLIDNRSLMSPLVERLEKDYPNVEARVRQNDYSKFYVDFVIKDFKIGPPELGDLRPRVRMNNSYDGRVKYGFNFGFDRMVCKNGLHVPANELQSSDFKLRHTPGTGGTALAKTMESIEIFLTQAGDIVKLYDPMLRKMKWDKAMELVTEVLEETKFPKKKEEEVIARLTEEKGLGLPVNDFMVYNALNYVLYSDDSRMKTHKKDKLDQQVLNYIVNR